MYFINICFKKDIKVLTVIVHFNALPNSNYGIRCISQSFHNCKKFFLYTLVFATDKNSLTKSRLLNLLLGPFVHLFLKFGRKEPCQVILTSIPHLRYLIILRVQSDSASFIITFMCAKSLQQHPTLCDPRNCSPPISPSHGILHARILEWVAMPSIRIFSNPRD